MESEGRKEASLLKVTQFLHNTVPQITLKNGFIFAHQNQNWKQNVQRDTNSEQILTR